jgi:hypothetical protein
MPGLLMRTKVKHRKKIENQTIIKARKRFMGFGFCVFWLGILGVILSFVVGSKFILSF